jgi:hypothetical protein
VLSVGIGANTHGDQLSVPVAPALSATDIHLWLVAAVGCGIDQIAADCTSDCERCFASLATPVHDT